MVWGLRFVLNFIFVENWEVSIIYIKLFFYLKGLSKVIFCYCIFYLFLEDVGFKRIMNVVFII